MPKINPKLEQRLQDMPNRVVDLIVRTNSDPTPYLDWLTANHIEIKQQFKLSPGMAVSSSGRDALKLLEQDWVVSIEMDEGIKAM